MAISRRNMWLTTKIANYEWRGAEESSANRGLKDRGYYYPPTHAQKLHLPHPNMYAYPSTYTYMCKVSFICC
jgi:hypothetical protein